MTENDLCANDEQVVTTDFIESNRVSEEAVAELICPKSHSSRREKAMSVLSCYTNSQNDTLIYVINNPGGGWTLFSTDKRISPVLASSTEGTFELSLLNDNMKQWVDMMGSEMLEVRKSTDEQLKLSANEIKLNKEFWASIENPNDYIRSNNIINPPLPWDSLYLYGHYELVSSTSVIEVVDEIERLTKTDWSQDHYTNIYCPYTNDDYTKNCPAGCVAIAGSQMLYLLHFKYNVPATAPTVAYCNSVYDQTPYDWAQTNFSTYIWDNMGEDGYLA